MLILAAAAPTGSTRKQTLPAPQQEMSSGSGTARPSRRAASGSKSVRRSTAGTSSSNVRSKFEASASKSRLSRPSLRFVHATTAKGVPWRCRSSRAERLWPSRRFKWSRGRPSASRSVDTRASLQSPTSCSTSSARHTSNRCARQDSTSPTEQFRRAWPKQCDARRLFAASDLVRRLGVATTASVAPWCQAATAAKHDWAPKLSCKILLPRTKSECSDK
mmetsp:Transcript_6638/g.20730  ORF Transcript_6638/g.20730 Transcript_6638/m.20730 type:complete len:219 (+) Transcript_6638:152-808(+)